jgi:integrase
LPLYRLKPGGAWYVDIRRGRGGRTRFSTRTTDRKIAQRKHDELAARFWQQKQSGKTLADALLAWLQARPRNPSEIRALRLIRANYGDRPLFEVTEASLIEAFGNKRAATYNRLMTIFRAALRMAERAGWIERAPPIERRKAATPPFRWLTRAEWRKVRAELAPHLRDMADFALATGLRWSNVALLTWSQVSLARKHVTIEAAKAKGRKHLAVPLSPAAVAVLRRVPGEHSGHVFTYEGRPLGSPKKGWNAALRRSSVAPATWHDLRHTWASWHVQNGTPLAVLRELGGWSSLEQVMIYAHLAPSHLSRYAGNAERKARVCSGSRMWPQFHVKRR